MSQSEPTPWWPYRVETRPWLWKRERNPNHTIVTLHPHTKRMVKRQASRMVEVVMVDSQNRVAYCATESTAERLREQLRGV